MIYTSILGDSIELTDERWIHILNEHPEVKHYKDRIQEVLASPDYIKQSGRDAKVSLYYKFYNDIYDGKYILIVVKRDLRSFILTCYITDIIKKGATLWERK
ncbi:MAG: hypothetical protein AB1480_04555 [Nitrospirota bacterium]